MNGITRFFSAPGSGKCSVCGRNYEEEAARCFKHQHRELMAEDSRMESVWGLIAG